MIPAPHPDNIGDDYEDLDRREDDYAASAARHEVELKNRKYAMSSSFLKGYRGGVLVDQKSGKTLCELKFAGNSPCAEEVIDFARNNAHRYYTSEYAHDIVDILKAHGTVDADATPEDFLLGLGS